MSQIAYISSALRFAFRSNKLWLVYILGTLISIVFELVAIAALVPLSALAAGNAPSSKSLTAQLFSQLGVPLTEKTLLAIFLVAFAARIFTLFLNQALSSWLSRQLLAKLTTNAFENIITNTPLRQVESKSIGSFIALAGDEANRASLVVSNLSVAFSQFALIALYYIAILIYSPVAAGAILAFLVIAGACLLGSFRYTHRLGDRQSEQSRASNSIFLDALNGLRSVRANRAEGHVSHIYRRRILDYVDTLVRLDVIAQAARLGPAVVLLAILAAVLAIPGLSAALLRDFAFLMTLILMMMRLFPVIGQTLITFMKIVADIRVGRDVTQLAATVEQPPVPAARPMPVAPKLISIRQVSFAHDDKLLLRDFSCELRAGRSYAIVGPSGCGKSTLFDLLLNFASPQEGVITVDGIDLRQIEPRELRKKIILVSQDVTIFNDTIENNIKFGIDCPPDVFNEAAATACLDEFVEALEDGYQTKLNYRGTNLSGGQKQRIGIARALVRDPKIILLDECTSALDPFVRQRVVTNLIRRFEDDIIVFITHDDWVARQVDEVLDFAALRDQRLDCAS